MEALQIRLSRAGIFVTTEPRLFMIIHENILGAIGNTPMIRLNQGCSGLSVPCFGQSGVLQPGPQRERPHGPEHGGGR